MSCPLLIRQQLSALTIKNFDLSTKETELLTVLSGIISMVSALVGTHLSGQFDQRCLCIIGFWCGLLGGCFMAFALVQAPIGWQLLDRLHRRVSPLMYFLAGANVASHTTKVTMNIIVLISFCLGNILGPCRFVTKYESDCIPQT